MDIELEVFLLGILFLTLAGSVMLHKRGERKFKEARRSELYWEGEARRNHANADFWRTKAGDRMIDLKIEEGGRGSWRWYAYFEKELIAQAPIQGFDNPLEAEKQARSILKGNITLIQES